MENTAVEDVVTVNDVYVGQQAATMDDAIDFVGQKMIERGLAPMSYVESMKVRERSASTFLGNGVAMPHGTLEEKDSVMRTGVVVAQYPEGVDWGPGTAHLVIGLAANGDEHVQLLAQMAEVLQDEELCEQLWVTPDAAWLHGVLSGSVEVDTDSDDDDGQVTLEIANPAGLHARPATKVVELAKASSSDVLIIKDGKSAKGDSIMSVLALGATQGDTVTVEVSGPDSEQTMAAVVEILSATEEIE